MRHVMLWFRNDLRLHDHPALQRACAEGTQRLLPVFCLPDPEESTPWGFARMGQHRRAWWAAALRGLQARLQSLGCPLLICQGPAAQVLPALARAAGITHIVCEDIAAPEEQAEVQALRAAGLPVQTVWQSSLLEPACLPWPVRQLPAVFTPFRQAVEAAGLQPPAPLLPPTSLPPWPAWECPAQLRASMEQLTPAAGPVAPSVEHWPPPARDGDETAARAHLAQYLARGLPESYKRTRNQLTGRDFSSKWSVWLATGALSARQALAELREFEARHGVSDGSYWLWFELLWRDYFRFLHLQHGRALYRARGLAADRAPAAHDARRFARWCQGRTGEPLVDAAMRELAATGYLSNRLRQLVASYLVHDLACDWRAGAAWFEAQLIDYDVYSNQGNWLYVAGRGTDPRGGRRFDPARQAAQHDPDGRYQRLWGTV